MPCPTDGTKNSVVSAFFVFAPVCGAPCKKYIPFFCKKLLTNRDQVAIINKRRGQQAQTKPTGDSHNGSAADSDSARGSSILSSPTTETAAARMLRFFSRGVAQMVARLVRDQEAVGSNPVTPTKKLSASAGSFFVAQSRQNRRLPDLFPTGNGPDFSFVCLSLPLLLRRGIISAKAEYTDTGAYFQEKRLVLF